MKNLLILLLIIISTSLFSQNKVDTIINNKAYSAYVNKALGQPLYVKYKLYKGGGKCQRATNWINDTKLKLVNENQYKGSEYDKGHLANAEDFAYDCSLDKLTFRYYNRIPQTKELNRGIWKKDETKIRKISQTDSLIVYCGGYWNSSCKVVKGMKIPEQCWKVVYSLSKKKVIYCCVFTNTDNPIKTDYSLSNLEALLGYSISTPDTKKPLKIKKK